jgi:hypothetical protein
LAVYHRERCMSTKKSYKNKLFCKNSYFSLKIKILSKKLSCDYNHQTHDPEHTAVRDNVF